MRRKNPLIIFAIKWVLGKDFLNNPNRYRVNTNICSRFIASLLDYGQSGVLTTLLTWVLFPKDYLGGLNDVVAYHVPFLGLPVVSDLERFIMLNEEVAWHPLISGLKTMTLSSHQYHTKLAIEFLLRVHLIVPVPKGTDWYTGFIDYIFPRIFMPDQQPTWCSFSCLGSLRALLTQNRWGKKKNMTKPHPVLKQKDVKQKREAKGPHIL